MALESSQRELQDWFRACPNRRLGREVVMAQSLGNPNRDSFETISRLHFGSPGTKSQLGVGTVEQRRKYCMGEGGGFPRVQAVVSQVSPRLPVACPNTKKGAEWVLTNLWLVLDAWPCNKIIVPLPSLISGLLACPSYPFQCWKSGATPKFQLSAIQHN
jgi:hypothetical protein